MTVRFLVLYTKPDDPQSWEQHYQGTHIPAARNIPGIERLWTGLASRAHDEEPAYYRVTETDFADQADFDAATDSAEWQESAPAGLTVPRPSSRRVSGGQLVTDLGVPRPAARQDVPQARLAPCGRRLRSLARYFAHGDYGP
jgi:uncharacterized protein (TIGR02118 family)